MRIGWLKWLLVLLPFLWVSCVGESSYETETGTFSIPWGEKEGQNDFQETLLPQHP